MAMTETEANRERAGFLREAIAGLTARPKMLPGKFLWDEPGSVLFDRICDHPEYYPTRAETTLLPGVARDVAALVGPGATVVEYGSGASRKIRTLLDALDAPARYVAVDISRDYLEASVRRLAADYPQVEMVPVCADYSQPLTLPLDLTGANVLGFFPGTSVGNFPPDEVARFLGRARATLGPSRLLVGVDPNLDEARLIEAYGGCGGLMAALHRNVLARMNRELGTDFDLDNFQHAVGIRHDPFRVEARLVAGRAALYHLDSHVLAFEAGEGLRTDHSYKYAPDRLRALAERSGWEPEQVWLDPDGLFSLHLLRA
jgi:dimethylhistidine N-methyltransferase